MSVLLLIDGYNVISPVAAPRHSSMRSSGRKGAGAKSWLWMEREKFLEQLAEHLEDSIRKRTTVVFDSKNSPPDQPAELLYCGIRVQFAVDHPEADDLIEELIRKHHQPKHLTVVSSDHRIQVAAQRRRAKFFDSDPWYDALLDGVAHLGWKPKRRHREPSNTDAVDPSDARSRDATFRDAESEAGRGSGQSLPSKADSHLDISDDELQQWIDGLD